MTKRTYERCFDLENQYQAEGNSFPLHRGSEREHYDYGFTSWLKEKVLYLEEKAKKKPKWKRFRKECGQDRLTVSISSIPMRKCNFTETSCCKSNCPEWKK